MIPDILSILFRLVRWLVISLAVVLCAQITVGKFDHAVIGLPLCIVLFNVMRKLEQQEEA